jgi:DNA integrity scanning protein DisA with diadenylate cyclase activity
MGFNIKYFCAFIIVFAIEALIAVFEINHFIRAYLGDVFVVILIYTFIKTFVKIEIKWLALYIFIFAVLVEIGQYFHFVELLGLGDNKLATTVLGTSFDVKDIVCYFVGCAGIWFFERNFITLKV